MSKSLQKALSKSLLCLQPDPIVSVSDWSNENIYIPPAMTALPGRFNCDAYPWEREMLDSLLDPTVATHAWKMASQVGKTQAALAAIGYFVAHPAPIMITYPTSEAADAFVREKLDPMIAESESIKARMAEAKSRSAENNVSFKRFRGGFLATASANTISSLRRRSAKILIADEVDAFPPSTSGEGDPLTLLRARGASFSDAVMLVMSSPTDEPGEDEKDATGSRIERVYRTSDQRKWFCLCPHCNRFGVLEWEHLLMSGADPKTAYFTCPCCAKPWSEGDRVRAVMRGEWRPTAVSNCGCRGYSMSGLCRTNCKRQYGSLAEELAIAHAEALRSEETLKAFTNTVLNRCWKQVVETIDGDPLLQRREPYAGTIPAKVALLAAGVDVQSNRVEVSVYGVGLENEMWALEHEVFFGDPQEDDVWDTLEKFLTTPRKNVNGIPLTIHCVGVDTGHATDRVYRYCAGKYLRKVYAMKGRGAPAQPLVSLPHKSSVRRIRLFLVGTNTAKAMVYSRLKNEKPGSRGFIHFPMDPRFNEEFFKQLTSEVVVMKALGGSKYPVFEQHGRNEPLDCAVYMLAALAIANPDVPRLAKVANPPKEEPEKPPETTQNPAQNAVVNRLDHPTAAPKAPRMRPSGGWMRKF